MGSQAEDAQPWIQEALHGGDPDGAGLPAPELTHPDFSGFDPLQRVPKQELCEEFVFLPPWWQTPLWPGCHRPRLRGGRYQSAHPFSVFEIVSWVARGAHPAFVI